MEEDPCYSNMQELRTTEKGNDKVRRRIKISNQSLEANITKKKKVNFHIQLR
jgi:hypothetical protein